MLHACWNRSMVASTVWPRSFMVVFLQMLLFGKLRVRFSATVVLEAELTAGRNSGRRRFLHFPTNYELLGPGFTERRSQVIDVPEGIWRIRYGSVYRHELHGPERQ